MVEVFTTNVEQQTQAVMLEELLSVHFPLFKINFDIDDCDRILRVEGKLVLPEKIMEVLHAKGYHCRILE